jgi:hypothetical protein
MGRYAFDNITNVDWWENMQYVLDEVEPMYVFLRFFDQEKSPTLGEAHMQYTNTKHTVGDLPHPKVLKKVTNYIFSV